jgi:hypothetical protein
VRVVITVLSHFYNEEKLLPFWLKHHREIFDHGILIDYSSTDKSVEIVRSLCPNWEVIPSRNRSFNARLVDEEVMDLERSVDGWKICLNTTELVSASVRPFIEKVQSNESAFRLSGVVMIDREPSVEVLDDDNLLESKPWGINCSQWDQLKSWPYGWRIAWTLSRLRPDMRAMLNLFSAYSPHRRCRLLHRLQCGEYTPGRHSFAVPSASSSIPLFWMGLSPFGDSHLSRKLQIRHRIPDSDQLAGLGHQHFATTAQLQSLRARLEHFAKHCVKPEDVRRT